MVCDFIIGGGGSAGSVLANRLSANSATKVLVIEAGQATPHGRFPPEILDSYPGTAYFDPRFHWTELKVRTDLLLDGPAALRSYLIRRVITEGFAFEQLMRDDEALEAFLRKAAIGVWHASCSCHMGAEGDAMAVTDNQGRLRGVPGLRVVDASILPAGPVCEHELSNADGFREDRGRRPASELSAAAHGRSAGWCYRIDGRHWRTRGGQRPTASDSTVLRQM
jgi:choline dehydrogenase-like flavoprotein